MTGLLKKIINKLETVVVGSYFSSALSPTTYTNVVSVTGSGYLYSMSGKSGIGIVYANVIIDGVAKEYAISEFVSGNGSGIGHVSTALLKFTSSLVIQVKKSTGTAGNFTFGAYWGLL